MDAKTIAAARVPSELRTARLLLRPWSAGDAAELHPILVDNYARLAPWIPARVADPGSVSSLSARLAGFSADFAADKEWRYCIRSLAEQSILGEISLFPRAATGRTYAPQADRAEIGYWLRADASGRGYAGDAARAMVELAASFPEFSQIEIRCDERNIASAAIPRRLGFALESASDAHLPADGEARNHMQVWILMCASHRNGHQ